MHARRFGSAYVRKQIAHAGINGLQQFFGVKSTLRGQNAEFTMGHALQKNVNFRAKNPVRHGHRYRSDHDLSRQIQADVNLQRRYVRIAIADFFSRQRGCQGQSPVAIAAAGVDQGTGRGFAQGARGPSTCSRFGCKSHVRSHP